MSTFILAVIRNQQFFSLRELNEVIHERLHLLNHKAFQKKPGSRATQFSEERASLLPRDPFELAVWKTATVSFNYHVSVDGQFYSVPYDYIKRKVDVRATRHVVEVFFEGSRICSHVRLYGRQGQYSTQEAHMPPNHQQYVQWNGERFRKWAAKIGPNTAAVVEGILIGYKVEQPIAVVAPAPVPKPIAVMPEGHCPNCGSAIEQVPRQKRRRFCCEQCRRAWWNAHRDELRHRTDQSSVCLYCGKSYDNRGDPKRRYCSHSHYTAARFGGEMT